MPPAPLVTLVDRALPEARFAHLLRAVRALRTEGLRTTYQTTFWYPLRATPSNLVEHAVPWLLGRIPAGRRDRVLGVEWWLSRMRTSHVGVDFHRDRDNALYAATGREVHPLVSSVLYLNRCQGGLLAVTREPPDARNPALAPALHDFDLVAPAPNRYVWFDGSCTHGVLDAENCIPGRRLAPQPRWRLAIAINLWRRRPRGVPTYQERPRYRALSLDRARPDMPTLTHLRRGEPT
jgi:hypothetical protein